MAGSTDFIVSLIKQGSSKRLLNLYFPREDGPKAGLLIDGLQAEEEVGRDFTYILSVLSDDPGIELKDVQGKMVCVELLRDDKSKRYFNGYCFEFALLQVGNDYAQYQMVLKPWLAFFRLRRDYCLYHDQSISEQTKNIFLESGLASYELQISEPDPARTFSCQYDESDYNYLHRRWEEMGWHYWYEHTLDDHKLILSCRSPACKAVDGDSSIPWHHAGGSNRHDKIENWQPQRQVVAGKVVLANFDFKKPTPQLVSHSSERRQGEIHKFEVYQYEGLYGYTDPEHGKNVAQRRMEQIDSHGKFFHGDGQSRNMQAGRWFKLRLEHSGKAFQDEASVEFFLLSVSHHASNNYLQGGGHATYSNRFCCIRRAVPYRPPIGFNSDNTKVPGMDTATVTGPSGEEIHTDKYGRIKVQFHWDRAGKHDEKSSCWQRVMTPWADKNFGMIALPRVGTEVVIQYLQGNPDRPLVVGQLYNERHLPPWTLPAHKTQSGILTRSSKGGTAANANALRFEDKKGAEEIWLHAEKNQRIEVENDESHWVGHDRKKNIDHDEDSVIGHNRSKFVGNDEANRIKGRMNETIKGDALQQVGGAKNTLVGKNYKIEAGDSFEITCGKAKFYMDKSGNVAITGENINITANGPMQINGKKVDINPAGGGAAGTPSPKGGGGIISDVNAQFPENK